MELKIADLRHPYFYSSTEEWQLWRDTYQSGRDYVNKYLKQFSKREDNEEFALRKQMTPCPAFAAEAVDAVKNSIYQRMIDISRKGGSKTYENAVLGQDDGVDLLGSSMNYFVGQKILPELLTMKRVGVYVDMPSLNSITQLDANVIRARPYIYMYKAEEILNWVCDYSVSPSEYLQVLLEETYNVIDPIYGFTYKTDTRYRYMRLNENGYVEVHYYNTASKLIDEYGVETNAFITLNIKRIPFHIFELPHSLLKDISRYQIALLNIGSSDINYILRANFPFYVEQQDFRTSSAHTRTSDEAGEENRQKEVKVGVASGRAYPIGANAPSFIHPSSEPLKASMDKQEQLKRDIRLLLNLAITNMAPTKQQSAESKNLDTQGLEAGLSAIGLELEKGENRLAQFWAMYENSDTATVQYPTKYSLKSEDERRAEIKQYKEELNTISSKTLQKELAKLIARALVGYKVSREIMEKIENEIDKASFILGDALVVQKNVELGILDRENAAKGFLYPDNTIDKANIEHAERLIRIAASQTSGTAARGVNDISIDNNAAKNEKTIARNPDGSGDNTINVRGAGNG